jgi:hypothetical protein
MTAFDDRLYHTLVNLAGDQGRVQIGVRQLANLLDVSDRSIRDSRHRLEQVGRIAISAGEHHFDADILTLREPQPAGDLTEGLGCEREPPGGGAPAGLKPPPWSPGDSEKPKAPSRSPDPNCPVCDGTGWAELPDPPNTVEPCRCLGAAYRSWWWANRRKVARSWPRADFTEHERPARADYTATMLEWNRRQLAGTTGSAAPPPPPEPAPARPALRLVEDLDEAPRSHPAMPRGDE